MGVFLRDKLIANPANRLKKYGTVRIALDFLPKLRNFEIERQLPEPHRLTDFGFESLTSSELPAIDELELLSH